MSLEKEFVFLDEQFQEMVRLVKDFIISHAPAFSDAELILRDVNY